MASGSFNLTRTGSTSSYITFKCSWSSKPNQSANTSTVTVTVTASKSSSSTASTYGNQTTTVKVGSASQSNSGSFTLAPGKSITLLSKTYTVAHNSDGSKSVTISASVGGNVMYGSGSATVALDKIPRYATVTQSLVSRTETTAAIKWVSDSMIDYIWYSTNNGSSWTGINVADGTSGQYTLSGLTAGTTYNVKTRVRRKDSQLTTDSTALAVSTYKYPYASSMPSFTIGSKLTIGLYNPLGRSVTVNIIGADGSQVSNDTTKGTSISGYNGTTVVNRLYSSIPTAQNGVYKVKVTYGTQITTSTGGTYTVNSNVCKPSIGGGTYKDVNSTSVAITENNQEIVQNQSIVQYTATGLTANNGATVKSCSVTVNGTSYNLTISGSSATGGNAVINSGTDVDAVFTVTDSRGLTASTVVPVSMIAWSVPTAVVTLERQDNYYSECNITVNANYASINGNNGVTITYTAVTDTKETVSGSLTNGETSVITLDNNFAWTVTITMIDSFRGVGTYIATVSRGMPIIFFDRIKSSVGVNCFPQNEQSFEINGSTIYDLIYPVGSIYMSVNNVSPGTLFGGTWVQIKDTFLLASGSTYSAGSTGGEASHVLTTSEMPSHTHTLTRQQWFSSDVSSSAASSIYSWKSTTGGTTSTAYKKKSGSDMTSTGGGKAHNNMPPYLAVYVWKRTA